MRALAWATTVALAAALLVRLLGTAGVPDTWLTAPLLGAFPWVVATTAGVTVVVAAAALAGGPGLRAPAAVLTAATVVGAALLVPRTLPRPQPASDGQPLTVAVVNARIGGADADEIVAAAAAEDLDLLAVVEGTTDFDAALRAAGIDAHLPAADVGPAGAVHAVGQVVPQRPGFPAGDTPDVVWSPPGGGEVVVTTLHAAAPIGDVATQRWADGLARTPPPTDRVAIVLGDFNATVDHATFRGLLDQGWRDAALEAGEGLAVTYDGIRDDSPALPMAIDHVLVSASVEVLAVRTRDVAGTDHRMLVVDLRLPAG